MDYNHITGKPQLLNTSKLTQYINDIIQRKVYTNNGPLVQELEQELQKKLGIPHCIAVSNATQGLYLSIEALKPKGWEKKPYVAVPSFTFIATIHAITQAGMVPLFVDVDDSGLMSIEDLTRVIHLCSLVIPVNIFGNLVDSITINTLADVCGIPVLYDSAHSILSNNPNYRVETEVFSLHATKMINAVEGGVVATYDPVLASVIKMTRNFGFVPEGPVNGECIGWGTNAKLSEFHAAVGLCNLESSDIYLGANYLNYLTYVKHLPKEVCFIKHLKGSNMSYMTVIHQYRDKIRQHLLSKGILSRVYFKPCHEVLKDYTRPLPNTDKLSSQVLSLPTGVNIKHQEIEYICDEIKKALDY